MKIMVDIADEYRLKLNFSTERASRAIQESMKNVHGNEQFFFDGISGKRAFRNPVTFVSNFYLTLPTYICPTHGDLTTDNIIVDQLGQVWLIDFGATGEGHILRDIAALDFSIRCGILLDGQATMQERLELEELLTTPATFDQLKDLPNRMETENVHLGKVYEVILGLRKLGLELVDQNRNADIREYYVALLYLSLNALKFFSLTSMQRHHALLSAAIHAEALMNAR